MASRFSFPVLRFTDLHFIQSQTLLRGAAGLLWHPDEDIMGTPLGNSDLSTHPTPHCRLPARDPTVIFMDKNRSCEPSEGLAFVNMTSMSPPEDLSNLKHGTVSLLIVPRTPGRMALSRSSQVASPMGVLFPGHRLGLSKAADPLKTALHPSAAVLVKWPSGLIVTVTEAGH